ncbi:Auxin Efflux Carrier [Desulfonatronospira thiodismutans ASO3-1]|uniref:Auxin Efflux Carrier n=1 Tax=Desulfonatronospira thiodismutans ASO3-1 TaxID=555779 RepID=D6SKG6_9BACT|nr:AEC family transporter [Desulfonatronospira thiodismutans]EFI36369.1 Auxin Efflux Carrier [Desulfonatronospira thiodismutans ASO3-1]
MSYYILPVFFVIILGYVLKNCLFKENNFWGVVQKSTYYIFLPALLFENISQIQAMHYSSLLMMSALLLSVLIISLFLFAIKPYINTNGHGFSSAFQGSLRQNVYIGMMGASTMLGDEGLMMSSIAMLGLVPLLNFLSVPTVIICSNTKFSKTRSIYLAILKNPLIVASVAGLIISQHPVVLPDISLQIFSILGQAALPLGLLAVGASLQLRSVNLEQFKLIALSSTVKLLVYPFLTAMICYVLGVSGSELVVAILFASLPTAAGSFILAKELGGDHLAMSSIITFQTIFSFITIPFMLAILT